MNEALFNLGFNKGWLEIKQKYANKPRKNKIVEKEREIQKLIYSIKPKITWNSYLQ